MKHLGDDNFSDYRTRVNGLVTDEAIASSALSLRPAGKFGRTRPHPYGGYTIITPPSEDEPGPENKASYEKLAQIQQELFQQVDKNMYVPVPPSSLHVTIADLLSGSRLDQQEHLEGWEDELVNNIRRVFDSAAAIVNGSQPNLLLSGLGLFPSVIVAMLTSDDEFGYDRLVKVRNLIYEDQRLRGIGVKRPDFSFTGHVTLAYVEQQSTPQTAASLTEVLTQLNRRAFVKPWPLRVASAHLRKFDDMSCYYRQANWPELHF